MGLAFFPRGGSAHVARNLATALGTAGWDVTILSGSVTRPGEPGDARAFYAGLDVRPQDFTRALEAADPMRADPPMHPSYEDRPGAPDRVFAALDDAEYERQVVAWCRALQSVDAAAADVLHLHHLTPLNEAAARVAPGVPIVGHLHGTELLMLEAIEADPGRWAYGAAWTARMRDWAGACERIILLSETQERRAEELLGVGEERCVLVPAGEEDVLHPDAPDRLERMLALPLAREAADEHERRAAREAGPRAGIRLHEQRHALDLGEAADVQQHRRLALGVLEHVEVGVG
jgi:hypothetical protein